MKMTALILGAVLAVIALILGSVQLLHVYNIYGDSSNKWYFYGAIGLIGLVGIAAAAWGLMKKTTPQQTTS